MQPKCNPCYGIIKTAIGGRGRLGLCAAKGAGKGRVATMNMSQPTFSVSVKSEANGTWSGTARWIEGGEACRFDSMLALLRFIDEAAQARSPLMGGRPDEGAAT